VVRFAAGPYDQDIGQDTLRARRFDPPTGRFTQPDLDGMAGDQNLSGAHALLSLLATPVPGTR